MVPKTKTTNLAVSECIDLLFKEYGTGQFDHHMMMVDIGQCVANRVRQLKGGGWLTPTHRELGIYRYKLSAKALRNRT